ncbi:MAG: CHAP domain-containing protein [Clostridia bacterium]|nr:CHAP domain-containing protein [Clostridia bacterium]
MKKIRKITALILSIILIIAIVPFGVIVNAETNPYGKWQTISGVTTVRCTYYAWQQAYDNTGVALPNFGNAKNWYTSAQNAGYSVGTTPTAKSIAVWTNSGYGHVGYVVSVNGAKMTVNEGGMLNTNGTAYNGDGIINGSTCNSTVGSNKSSYSSSVLVGFIYLTENASSSVSLSIESSRNTITETNAILYGRVDKPSSYTVTKIGIKIRKDGGTYSDGWSKYEAPSQSYAGHTYMLPYYNMNTELNLTLIHSTKYYYKFFAIVNGTEYWSKEASFTTGGSHSYGAWSVTKSASCTVAGKQSRKCKGCSKTETKTITALGHNYSSAYTVDTNATCGKDGIKSKHCSRCGSKTSITTILATNDHTYSNKCDSTCNVCGKSRTITHSYKTTTEKATTSKSGIIAKKCTVCGKIASTATVNKIKSVKLSANEYTYNGKAKKPSVTVYDAKGKKLKNDVDYTVKYASGRKKVGKYKVTITFKGNYSGTKTLYFKINPKETNVSKVTAAKKSLRVKIKKQSSQTTGYQIEYSTSKKFKSAKTKTIKSYKTTSYTIKSLKAKKTYYVRVRTYKTVDGEKYYSDWSSYKYKKTK